MLGLTVKYMRGSLKIIKEMVKAKILGLTVKYMREIGKMVKKMVWEDKLMKMVLN